MEIPARGLSRFDRSGQSGMDSLFARRGRARLVLRWVLLTTLLGSGLWLRSLSPPARAVGLSEWWPWARPTIVTLYFSDGPFLFPVSRRTATTDDVPRAALQALLDGPRAGSGLTSPIPPGVRIRSVRLAAGVAHIDLSAAMLAGRGGTAETAIVETMTALPEVSAVALSVEGTALAAPTARIPLLYYASPMGLAAIPGVASTPRDAIAMYMAGPPDTALTGVPRDVHLLKYTYDPTEGLVSLNFGYTPSLRTLALEKPDITRFVILGLIASLTEFRDVRAVRVDFGGQARLGLGQCSDLLRVPLPRPRLLNDERLLGR